MLRLTLILFFLCATTLLNAQQAVNYTQYIERLTKEFNAATSDSVKTRRAFDLVDQWSYTDSIKAKIYLEKGRKQIGKNSYLKALYQFYYSIYIYDIDFDSAMQRFMQAERMLQVFQLKEAYYFRARCWRNFATLQQRKDDENGMMASLINHAIPLAQKADAKELEGELNSLVGLVFMNQHIYHKAIQQFRRAIFLIGTENPTSVYLNDAYTYLIKAYCFSDSLEKARSTLDELRNLLAGQPESVYHLSLYDVESIFFRKAKQFNLAENALDKGIALAYKLKDSVNVSSIQFNKFKLLFDKGSYIAAKSVLQEVMNGPGMNFLENKLMYYNAMSETYEKLNDLPNAYRWLKKMFNLWDSAYVEKMRANIIDIEAKYQKAEKETEILYLKNQQALERQKIKTKSLVYLSIIGLLLSTVIITYLQLRNKRRKEQLLQNEIKSMENEKKLSTYEALIEGQEKERNRLATELHDGLGGMLAAVKMNLSATSKDIEGINSIIEHSTAKLDHSIQELRLIARNLMPPSLRKLGLVNALQDFCDGLKTEQLNIIFQSYDFKESEIDGNTKLIIYRIFQELITNAFKHSEGTEILADLVRSGDQIQITVEDNGKGFHETDEMKNGIGLANIRSRVDFLKGAMAIESNSQWGTTISINFKNTNG